MADRKADLKKIFPDWSDEKIQYYMDKTDHPEIVAPGPNPTPAQNFPIGHDNISIGSDPYQNTAKVLTNGGIQQPTPSYNQGGRVWSPEEQMVLSQLKGSPVYAKGFADGGQVPSDLQDELSQEQYIQSQIAPREQVGELQGSNINGSKLEAQYNPEEEKALAMAPQEPIKDEELDSDEVPSKPSTPEEAISDIDARKKESQDAEIPLESKPEDDTSSFSRLIASLKPQPNGLKDAQNARDMNIASQNIAKGAALLSGGISGADPSRALELAKENDKYVQLPVQKYEEQLANQENDPKSNVSQAYRDLYHQLTGKEAPADWSGKDIKSVSPIMEKVIQARETAQIKKEIYADKLKSIEEQKQKDRDLKALLAGQANDAKKDRAAASGNLAQDRSLTQTQQLLESARGNPAAAQAEKDLYSTQKANSLIGLYKDPNKLSPQQVNLLVSEVAKIATGGVPTGHEQAALQPGTAESKLASFWSKLQNHPNSANAGAFIKQFKDYNDALTKDAKKVIQDKYGRIIETRKHQLGDDNYQALQDQYINRFKEPEESSPDQGKSISKDEYNAYAAKYGEPAAQNLLSKGGYKLGQ